MTAVSPANIQDLEKRSFRPLDAIEKVAAETYLEDAWFLLIRNYPQVEKELDPVQGGVDDTFKRNVMMLLVAMVKRVVDNPDSKFEETGDDYSYRRTAVASDGRLQIYEDEIGWLFPANKSAAFSIRPTPSRPPGVTPFWGPIVRAPLPDWFQGPEVP